jgi:RHS repeat-associated protein
VTTRYVHGPLSRTPAYFIRGGQTYAIVTDNLGSVRSVVRTSDGTVMQAISYDPWGKVLTDSSPGFQPFGFAGGLYDKDTGLVHFGAREYDGATGRWTSKDPSRFAGGANLYAYSFGDPVNWVDPTGNAPCPRSALDVDYTFAGASIGVGSVYFGAPLPIDLVVVPQFTYDSYGHVYFGIGAGIGSGGLSAGSGAGHLLGFPCDPTEAELEDYLTGWSLNGSAGFTGIMGIGGGVGSSTAWSSGVTGVEASASFGLPGPSWSYNAQYTWKLF